MAVYKVPQDVEADDKLIGPFSFRQFIYLGIVAGGIGLGWVLGKLFLPLAIIPLPVIVLFGALALPLRKDQPMETYLAAIVSFYIKPHKRMWEPDGQQSLIEITTPTVVQVQRTNELTQSEAERRLSYLANVVDSRGWAVRGVQSPDQNTSLNTDVFYEAQQAEDVFDNTGRTSHMIDDQLDRSTERHREELLARMKQQPSQEPSAQMYTPSLATGAVPQFSPQVTQTPQADDSNSPAHLTFNPYPTNMQQTVIRPIADQLSKQPVQQQQTQSATQTQSPQPTSNQTVSPDIISLANNPDLSIETIAHEASRIQKKRMLPNEEVVISLH